MNSENAQPDLVMIRRLDDGQVEWIPLQLPERVPVAAGTDYAVVDRARYEAPQTLVARREGEDLVVEVQGAEALVLGGFFATEDVAFYPTTDIASGAGPFSQTPLTPDAMVISGVPGQIVWSAQPVEPEPEPEPEARTAEAGKEEEGMSPLIWGGFAVGGLGLIAAASGGGGGGGGGDGGEPPPPPAPTSTTVAGTVVAGPVIPGNGLSVDVFEADGTTLLGQASVGDDGSFSVDVGEYTGAVVIRLQDADGGPDHRDEASGDEQDLNAALSAVAEVTGTSGTLAVNVNPLTTLAAGLAERVADGGAPSAAEVSRANAAVAELFGLSSLHGTAVAPVNGGSYDADDGLSESERYGAVLAAFSGATLDNGGDAQQTIDAVLAGLTLSGSEATLSEDARSLLLDGARTAERETGESIAAALAAALDAAAPSITSGATADAIAENSGAGQVVYTATATDDTGVTWSLESSGDGAAFSIDADSGEVTLIENPDFETRSSYTFTVVATDAAGNSASRTVSLGIEDRDDSAPFITSGAVAAAIDENSGDDQVIYTATAEDDGTVTWSLADSGDADAFEIDEDSGAVTLEDDPDHEEQAAYTFTVVATDDEGNRSEQRVSLTINDLDEVAPTITSGATAAAIDEGSGAGQVVYTVTSTDDDDVSTGDTSYSLTSDDDGAAFEIDARTGAVTLLENPDFEATSSYRFTVVATDAAGNRSELDVTLPVNDLDDEPPDITSGATATSVAENSGDGQVVYTATADDDGPVSWSLADSGDGDDFSIDADSGAVTLTGDPDFEAQSSYTFTVVATDEAGNSSQQAVTLAIGNVDEVAPTITSGGTATAIEENSGAGQVIYTVTSTDDGDVSSGETSYSLTSDGDADAFEIDADSGEVTLIEDPDFEARSSYTFTVVATDAAGNSSEQVVTLAVEDVADETPPTLSSSIPADDATGVSPASDIVLTFSETVQIGSGTLTISNGSDTRTIDVTDGSQVSVSGAQVTINPTEDLEGGSAYNVQIASGAFTDAAGNPFAGISDTTTLNFETGADTSIVVFDLLQGSSSDHSGRTFQSDVSYDIYIRVDSSESTLSTDGDGPGTWGTWSGAENLGSDDRVILVGDGEPVRGLIGVVNEVEVDDDAVVWQTAFGGAAASLEDDTFERVLDNEVELFESDLPESFLENQGGDLDTMYFITMPAGILTSQGLV